MLVRRRLPDEVGKPHFGSHNVIHNACAKTTIAVITGRADAKATTAVLNADSSPAAAGRAPAKTIICIVKPNWPSARTEQCSPLQKVAHFFLQPHLERECSKDFFKSHRSGTGKIDYIQRKTDYKRYMAPIIMRSSLSPLSRYMRYRMRISSRSSVSSSPSFFGRSPRNGSF